MALSGLELVKKQAAEGSLKKAIQKLQEPPDKPKIKEISKKQPFFVWVCTWKITQRRQCKVKITGPTRQTVDRNSDMHWDKHQREAAKA